ncbi:MAG TPA: response regulator transcription factor [Chitinophagaceae bacterium]|nr:response regulator transcription factor [Chitinophagaceae bacterium]
MIRLLIADDHAIVRTGLKKILLEEYPSAIIEEVSNAEDLLVKIRKESWDMIISDLTMPGRSGLEALQQIYAEFPKLPVLILSMHPEEQFAVRLLKAGAAGYLNKEAAPTELTTAVTRILQGRKYITSTIAEQLAGNLLQDADKLPHETLSNREFEVLKLMATGKTVGDIAELLFLSVTTVSTYRARILEKLSLKTNAELILYAINNNLV